MYVFKEIVLYVKVKRGKGKETLKMGLIFGFFSQYFFPLFKKLAPEGCGVLYFFFS